MRNFYFFIILAYIAMNSIALQAQDSKPVQHPTLIQISEEMVEVPSIAKQMANGTFVPSENYVKEFNPKRWGKNTSVPGKGLPKGDDPLWQQQKSVVLKSGKAPSLTFEAASSGSTPTDPTGAIGPNHFVNSWNTSFRIWDKSGNPLTDAASLGTILPGTMGDPIVIYDRYADRFLITEFYSNGFYVGISQGPDPVNDDWYTYTFPTNSFPDYPKFSVWSDGYYITANKDQGSASTSEVVFALERDEMINGEPTAQMLGFPLTDIVISGFYSPLGFNCNGSTLPPPGDAPIVYMQDDAWGGVPSDHIKLWKVNVNWTSPGSSTISSPQIIPTEPFDGLFDNGSFSNLPQPSGGDIDALQATIMYMAQYRRFAGYNSVVFNFVIDLDGGDDYSGIRWYELRQTNDGDPWTIYQEGTYSQPDGHSAFSGNMCMDANGNIALAYTTVSSSLFPSLRYTGRYAGDALGTMTFTEEVIANGTQSDPHTRYGDYSQMTIDPTDDATFWSIGEYFTGGTRKNHVGVFQIAEPPLTAEFVASPTQVCSGGSVHFADQSLGSPTSWDWTFTGGTPSSFSGQNPPDITYSSAGTYTVSLTVGDGIDTDTETKTGYITVENVIADFSGFPTTVVVGNTITFTDNSDCSPTTWSWDFPGGSPASFNGQNPPAITYNTEGTYNVSLTVTNAGGNDTELKTDYITVAPPEFNMQDGTITTCMGNFYDSGGPSGDYTNNEDFTMTFYPSTPGSMLRFNFTTFDIESHSTCNYDYLIIYDGENTSATTIGQYCGTNSPGLLTATNPAGAITFEFHSDGNVTDIGWVANISCYSSTDPPVADFSADNTTPLPGNPVSFTDLSSNIPTSWDWSFSPVTVTFLGGTTANSKNPQVQFNEIGLYTISLTATNAYGTDDEIKTDYINVLACTPCNSSYSNTSDDWISRFMLNTIDNSSGSVGYEDFTALSTDLNAGGTYPVSVEVTVTGSWLQYARVWIDWNGNCDFSDAGEITDLGATPGSSGTFTLNGSIAVPENAVSGMVRMRVSERYSSVPGPCDEAAYGETEDYSVNILHGVDLNLTAMLEGPFNGTGMNADINALLPLAQPFSGTPWNYSGTESATAIPGDVIDWVLVDLRDANSAAEATVASRITRQAAFITTSGQVVDVTGNPVLHFDAAITKSLFVALYHRNHLAILSGNAVPETEGSYVYNFSTGENQVYGTNAHKQLTIDIWGMIAGDGNKDGSVTVLDESPVWESQAGNKGLLESDYNLDGESNNKDKDDFWLPNLGSGTQVPD